jgi:hypothetical protein
LGPNALRSEDSDSDPAQNGEQSSHERVKKFVWL